MEAIFDSLGQKIYVTNSHNGYLIQWKLIAPFCKKWSRNRDADQERIKEMIDHHQKGGYIPRMIHLAELSDEGTVCYDGNHRKEVFNSFCNDESIMCIVDIMFATTQKEVYKAFNNINKSVQLPAIYIEEEHNNTHVKDEILALVKHYESTYKALLSPSARCHAPHFNRDVFTENIYNIWKSLGCHMSIVELGVMLDKLNDEYANGRLCRPHSLYKASVGQVQEKQNVVVH
jgi:hypothetical protein